MATGKVTKRFRRYGNYGLAETIRDLQLMVDELNAIIDEQNAKIEDLETRVQALETA